MELKTAINFTLHFTAEEAQFSRQAIDEQRKVVRELKEVVPAINRAVDGFTAALAKFGEAMEFCKTNMEKSKVKRPHSNVATLDDSNSRTEMDQMRGKTPRLNLNMENSTEIESDQITLLTLKNTLENNFLPAKIHVKRDYKLKPNSNFELWKDFLYSELMSSDLLDVIDSERQSPDNLSGDQINKRMSLVRDIIINHIDENYHKRILNVKDPKEILRKLKSFKKNESNITPTSIMTNMYKMKLRKGESINEFCERFDAIITQYENCDGVDKLSEKEIRPAFYQAVSGVIPELRSADLSKRMNENREMSLDEIKTFIFQLEAEKKSDGVAGGAGGSGGNEASGGDARNNSRALKLGGGNRGGGGGRTPRMENTCYRCNETGHWARDCHLRGDDWFCYDCKVIHNSENCPYKRQGKSNFNHNSRGKNFNKKGNGGKGNRNRNFEKKGSDIKNGRVNKKKNFNKKALKAAAEKQTKDSNNGENKIESLEITGSINFIADSACDDHIVNKSLILSNFEKCDNWVIKSANKNESADMIIDGKGDLFLRTNSRGKGPIKLTNVLAVKDVSDNLLSLRLLAEAGFGVYLDDKILRVFNKRNNKSIFEGIYEKPNWRINFEIIGDNFDTKRESLNSSYVCNAKIVSSVQTSEQSQNDIQNKQLTISEGAIEMENDIDSAIGREENRSKNELNEKLEELQTIKMEDIESLEEIGEITSSKIARENIQTEKLSEGMLWHVRLGHASLSYLKQLQKIEKRLEDIKFEDSIEKCEVCILAKMKKLPFSEIRNRADRPLHTIHSDIMGPITPSSYPGANRFIITFLDDYSRFGGATLLKTKDQAGDAFQKFLIHARNLLGKDEKICYVKSDQGREYLGGKFMEIMKEEKMELITSPPYTPEHNGAAERFNRTLQEKARAYMFDSGLPKSMWGLAVCAAVHAYNRTPHRSIGFETPLGKFNPGVSCHFEQIRRFGCIAYVKLPKPVTKFGPRAIRTILVGYSNTGYILWHPESRKFIESRHVDCNEKIVHKSIVEIEEPLEVNQENWLVEFGEENAEEETQKLTEPKRRGRPRKQTGDQMEKENLEQRKVENGPLTRSKANKRSIEQTTENHNLVNPVKDISYAKLVTKSTLRNKVEDNGEQEEELRHCLIASLQKDPVNYEEAVTCKEKSLWMAAIKDELESMKSNEAWEMVDRPKIMSDGRKANVIDSRWIFKRKLEANGSERYRARLVIRGCKDRNQYDLKETYAPVARLSLVRAILSIINKYDLHAKQLDVKTAFLNGVLENEIYMEIPDGVEINEMEKGNKVLKLRKALYGLRLSPKQWYKRFSEEMKILNLETDVHEPCLFTYRKNGDLVLVLLYVDDTLIASNKIELLEKVQNHLSKVFEMKDLGEPKNFLGICIERNRESSVIRIHQTDYILSILKRFNMDESKPQSTPMVTRQQTSKRRKLEDENLEDKNINKEIKQVPYREVIGSLLYLSNATRPDITFAVNFLARKQLEPNEEDWSDVKRVLRYLRKTQDLGITYTGQESNLEALTDASFRDCGDSTSTCGYVVKLFGDTVTWRSHKQTYITLSTCQAEYVAMSEVCQELISLDKSIRCVVGRSSFPATVRCDNRSAVDCVKMDGSHKLKMLDDNIEITKRNLESREKTGSRKHMAETHGDYIKECVMNKIVEVEWVEGKENLADIMTKPLPLQPFEYLRNKIIGNLEFK